MGIIVVTTNIQNHSARGSFSDLLLRELSSFMITNILLTSLPVVLPLLAQVAVLPGGVDVAVARLVAVAVAVAVGRVAAVAVALAVVAVAPLAVVPRRLRCVRTFALASGDSVTRS